jgi:hypothetical protein
MNREQPRGAFENLEPKVSPQPALTRRPTFHENLKEPPKMPRASAESRATASVATRNALRPSPHLTPEQAQAFRTIVASAPPGHLSETDRALLDALASITVLQRQLSAVVGAATAAELSDRASPQAYAARELQTSGKTCASLINRLKLGPLALSREPAKAGIRRERDTTGALEGNVVRLKRAANARRP